MNTLLEGKIISTPVKKEIPPEKSKPLVGSYCSTNEILSPKNTRYLECRNTPLLKENFLSEYLTKADKEKVRRNLGINSTIEWGEIGGYLENQGDLMSKFTEISEKINNQILTSLIFPNKAPYDNTGLTIGGLSKGSDIRNKSIMEVLDGFLYPEYLPQFIDATNPKLTFNGESTRTFEVGTKLPTLDQFQASPGTTASAIAGDYTIYGGEGICNVIKYYNTAGGDIGEATYQKGSCIFSVTCNYKEGTDPIKTSKGNNTQYTSLSSDTLVADGSDTSKTVQTDNGWVLKEIIDKQASISFNYWYKFFATTEKVGELNSGILKDSLGTWNVVLKAGGAAKTMFFIVPPETTVKSIMGYNEVSGKYDQDQTSNFEKDNYTYTLPSGNQVTYTKYAYKNAPTEDFKIQIS